MGRYWAALKERDNISATFKACVRSCYQRLHEVMRLMEAMRQRLPEKEWKQLLKAACLFFGHAMACNWGLLFWVGEFGPIH